MRPNIVPLLCSFLCALMFLASCSSESETDWLILVYLDGDNDLAAANLEDMTEMQAGAGGDHIRILVQFDQPDGVTAKRYEIRQHTTIELEDIGEVNMAEAQTLTDFLLWTKTKEIEQADRVMLILSDHGNGWDQGVGPSPAAKVQPRSMFVDYDNDTGSTPALHNHLVREAIERADIKLDLLGLDASVMGTIEALYEFSELAPIIISSQEVGYAKGWNYEDIFSQLASDNNISAAAFATHIVESYARYFEQTVYPSGLFTTDQRFSIAAHDATRFKTLVTEIDALAGELMLKIENAETREQTLDTITSARNLAQDIDFYNQFNVYVDLKHLSQSLGVDNIIPERIDELTIAEYHGKDRPRAAGISIVFFQPPDAWTYNTCDPNYQNWSDTTQLGNKGRFINESQWDEMLARYYKEIVPALDVYSIDHPCNRLFE